MKFLISVIDNQTGGASPAEMAAIQAFNGWLRASGALIFAGGLDAPQTATVLDNRNGAGLAAPGPFIASPEYVSGFWIVEAPDADAALALAAEASRCCHRRVELRPFLPDLR
ncbi:MAG: YciI family protein [Bryobacteraceae bacterium]|nr:YciI family protein [Bryobacteraceae bacterium]